VSSQNHLVDNRIYRREVVLKKVEAFSDDKEIMFDAMDEDVEAEAVFMPLFIWEAFCKPDHITITITPGDKLNE